MVFLILSLEYHWSPHLCFSRDFWYNIFCCLKNSLPKSLVSWSLLCHTSCHISVFLELLPTSSFNYQKRMFQLISQDNQKLLSLMSYSLLHVFYRVIVKVISNKPKADLQPSYALQYVSSFSLIYKRLNSFMNFSIF